MRQEAAIDAQTHVSPTGDCGASNPTPSRRKRKARWIMAILLASLSLGLVASQFWVLSGRTYEIEDGRLYRSAALDPDRLLAVCQRYGIRIVLDFRNTPEKARAEAAALQPFGVRHIHLPATQSLSPDTVERFLSVMDGSRGQAVLMHCTHGVGRTGLLTAIYRMEYQGWSPRRAWLEAMIVAGFGSFLPGSEKARRILEYRPRAAARAVERRP
jgi:protein tyrosine phosphatase (PTP) superfamily phosphohydrolase (DUF442 family)